MTVPLDPAQDPDRYDPDRDKPGREASPDAASTGPLDWSLDPDRFDPAADSASQPPPAPRRKAVLGRTGGTRETLPELLGEGSFDDKPSPYVFLIGLLGIAAFLFLVAFIFSNISP